MLTFLKSFTSGYKTLEKSSFVNKHLVFVDLFSLVLPKAPACRIVPDGVHMCVCVCVLVCLFVFLCLWGLELEFSLTVWGLIIFVGTKSWSPQL